MQITQDEIVSLISPKEGKHKNRAIDISAYMIIQFPSNVRIGTFET
jgi:hypothetical protein